MDKWIYRIIVLMVLVPACCIVRVSEYYCFRCGASKSLGIVRETDTSRRVRAIRGTPCRHHWLLNSSFGMLGCADCFANWKIPLMDGRVERLLQSVPSEIWRRQLLEAATDPENKLKWAVPLVLTETPGLPEAEEEWNTWRHEFDPLFQPEHDLAKAREKAKQVSAQFLLRRERSCSSSDVRSLLVDLGMDEKDSTLFRYKP